MNVSKASAMVNAAIKRGYAGINTWGAADYLMKHGSAEDRQAVSELHILCDRKYRDLQKAAR